MLGLIHRTLLSLIESAAGGEAVAEVKRRAGVPEDRAFRMGESYNDDAWQRLLASTCALLNISPAQAEEVFADFFGQDALQRWPTWFAMSKNARQFLERQPAIHNSFATGVHDSAARAAIADKFKLEKRDRELVMHYRSPNRLCGLYMAMARWIIKHYGDHAVVDETRCLKNGDPECELHILWHEPGSD